MSTPATLFSIHISTKRYAYMHSIVNDMIKINLDMLTIQNLTMIKNSIANQPFCCKCPPQFTWNGLRKIGTPIEWIFEQNQIDLNSNCTIRVLN
jgi:hypothetical protein